MRRELAYAATWFCLTAAVLLTLSFFAGWVFDHPEMTQPQIMRELWFLWVPAVGFGLASCVALFFDRDGCRGRSKRWP